MERITNRDIRRQKRGNGRTRPWRWWLAGIDLWLIAALITAFTHPLAMTLPAPRRLLWALPGPLLWPAWPLAVEQWLRVQAGALPLLPQTFAWLYAGACLALPALPWLVWQAWLSRPAPPHRVQAYRVEAHRQAQGQLTAKEARQLLSLQGPGLPLASLQQHPEKRDRDQIGLPLETLEGHVLVTGATRSGKGMHLTETLLRYPGAMVVIDPKSEQLQRTAGTRQQRGPVYTIPPHTLDLAAYFDLGDRDDVAELHTHLMKPWSDHQPVFADKAKLLFSAAHAFATHHGLNPIRVLFELADTNPALGLGALQTVAPDAVSNFCNSSEPGKMDRMASSAWGTFTTRMYDYLGHVDTITTTGTHTAIPADWADQNATIYITYPLHQLTGVGGVVAAIIAALMRYQIRTNARRPAVVAVDELPSLGLRNIGDYLATVGGYGLTLLLYVQAYSQLVEGYGRQGAETILSNCQHQIWYPPADVVTAQRIEELYGTKLQPVASLSRSLTRERLELDMGKRGRSVSEQLQTRPALPVGEAMAMAADEVILRVARRYAVRGYRLWPVPRLHTLPPLDFTVRRVAAPTPKTDFQAYLNGGTSQPDTDNTDNPGSTRNRSLLSA